MCTPTTSSSSSSSSSSSLVRDSDETNQIDFESKCGRFGWETIDGAFIPYIYRLTDKYCAIRIADTKLLSNYLHKINCKVYNNVRIPAYQLTNTEIKLLNEINTKHCDDNYGEQFTNTDYIIRLEDVKYFYEYLRICHYKLVTKICCLRDRCGFLRINKQLNVSYINKEDDILIPVFYFENQLMFRTGIFVNGWDVHFIKFCLEVQGIMRFANQTTIEVISLDVVKKRLPSDSCYEPFWPETNNTTFLMDNTLEPRVLHKMWTIQVNNIENITNNNSNNETDNKSLMEYGKPLEQIVFNQLQSNNMKCNNSPYHIAMLRVEHKFVPCINMRAYDSTEYLITLPDLVRFFLNDMPLSKCKEYLDSLNIQLYRGNWMQMQHLWLAKKCQTPYDYLPLMTVRDVRNNLFQFRLIIRSE